MYLTTSEKLLKSCAYVILTVAVLFSCLPVWMGIVAASLDLSMIAEGNFSLLPGNLLWTNLSSVLMDGISKNSDLTALTLLKNTFIVSVWITAGKILISLMSAYALMFFKLPFEKVIFGAIFITLMLPIEVRIASTYQVAVNFHMINSFAGIIFPLIASATATFLFRQQFLTMPKEIFEAALLDAAGPWKMFTDIVVPMSRNSIIALIVVTFISSWNQYLWPLLVLTDPNKGMINLGIRFVIQQSQDGSIPNWPYIMALSLLAVLPPLLIVFALQKYFVKGLAGSSK
ncbi:MAG: ABC transporter permease subunit [Brevinemataceae bacterium]